MEFRVLGVREFALERLADRVDAESVRLRHALAFLALAESAEEALRSGRPDTWLARLEEEYANLRTAERHLAATGYEDQAAWLALESGDAERAQSHADAALATGGDTAAQALIVLGLVASVQGDRAGARELLEAARSRAVTREDEANALDFLGELDLRDGGLAEAQRRFE
jgi:hypothetical protein